MQTLMEDYEVHKVKKRDKMEDSSVSKEYAHSGFWAFSSPIKLK